MVRRVPDFSWQVIEVDRVERLLRTVSAALDAAAIPYAVIGGNAVAAWVATRDVGAVRATKDVDLLLRREDLPRASAALEAHGFVRDEALGVTVFVERDDPLPGQGVHVILAGEKVRSHESRAAPDVAQAVRAKAGYLVLDLVPLIAMKLSAFRRVDQVHIEDLLRLGLIDAGIAATLPADLLDRLRHIRDTMEWVGSTPPAF